MEPAEVEPPVATGDTGVAPSGWRWERADVTGLSPRWGAATAGDLVIGGVEGMSVSAQIAEVAGESGSATVVAELGTPRYCACALYDPGRDEVVVIGGRNDSFAEAATVDRLSLADGSSIAVDAAGAADRPVGCHAFFSPALDRGWVFGGYGAPAFGASTWRYDPVASTFTELDAEGPSGRYDAGIEVLADGGVVLVGGMGDGAVFDSQVWRFDPDTEAWSELPATTESPPGRRFPFTAVTGERLVYGYGTDSPTGATVLRDLWTFDLASGVWEKVNPDGERPSARAFAGRWPGPAGSAGRLAFGIDEAMAALDDAWVLWPPGG